MTGWQTHQSYLLPAWRELQETQHHTTLLGSKAKSSQCPPQAWGPRSGGGEREQAWVPGQPGKPDASGPASSSPGIKLTEITTVPRSPQLPQTGVWFVIPSKMETTPGANSVVAGHSRMLSTPRSAGHRRTFTDTELQSSRTGE